MKIIITHMFAETYYAETTPIPFTVANTADETEQVLPVDHESACFFTALIAGGTSALGSIVIVLCISVVIHVTVYQCV